MTWVATAVVGTSVVTGAMSADAQKGAAKTAAKAQQKAGDAAIAEQQRQFDEMKKTLSPYVAAGSPALQEMAGYSDIGRAAISQQEAIVGLKGAQAQQEAIAQIEQNPLYQSQVRQGEEALLQQASATGGLRGGNTQAALSQFRPQMLQQAIDQQYSRLGGLGGFGAGMTQNLATIGQSSAAGQAAQGMNAASNVGNLLTQQGQAQAQSALLSGAGQAQAWGNVGQAAGTLGTLKLLGKF